MFNTGHHHYVFSAYQDADNRISIAFLSTDTFVVFAQNSSGTQLYLQTNKQFRDPSAWMNIVVAVDTENSTAGDRIRAYVNGSGSDTSALCMGGGPGTAGGTATEEWTAATYSIKTVTTS